jgi:hypothetical protein
MSGTPTVAISAGAFEPSGISIGGWIGMAIYRIRVPVIATQLIPDSVKPKNME